MAGHSIVNASAPHLDTSAAVQADHFSTMDWRRRSAVYSVSALTFPFSPCAVIWCDIEERVQEHFHSVNRTASHFMSSPLETIADTWDPAKRAPGRLPDYVHAEPGLLHGMASVLRDPVHNHAAQGRGDVGLRRDEGKSLLE